MWTVKSQNYWPLLPCAGLPPAIISDVTYSMWHDKLPSYSVLHRQQQEISDQIHNEDCILWQHTLGILPYQFSRRMHIHLMAAAMPINILTFRGVGHHVHHHFVWCNAKSFYCFSPWEKAGLCFQCILKSILHEEYERIAYKSLYSTTCLY